MIKVKDVVKKFGNTAALDKLSCEIQSGCVYGLVGSNGAGKSTLLRLLCGVYRLESGDIAIDGEHVYDNPAVKGRLAFVPDELYFLPNASMDRMAELYAASYDRFSRERYETLAKAFGLSRTAHINTFSKGMKRQAAVILALSTRPDYIFLDETFDGLDPAMRNLVRRVIYSDISERGATAVVASHSLRELEDTCDQLALLHKGGIVFESDIAELKTAMFKVQIAFSQDFGREMFDGVDVLNYSKKGSVASAIVRGGREEVRAVLSCRSPILLDILPLTLEEVFLYEMEALGYAFNDIPI